MAAHERKLLAFFLALSLVASVIIGLVIGELSKSF
jgi:hypothetical protein